MEEPFVSIVIPTCNRQDLLVKAVKSCLVQDWPNLEIIIVDDGSSDDTRAMVESLYATDWKTHDIRYVFQENSGASSARNRGLGLAKGDYIQFLDSDDELLPGKLRKQVDFLENSNDADFQMCYCYGRMGEKVEGNCVRIGVEAVTVKDLLVHLVSRSVHVMQTSAPLWRRSFLIQHEGWNPEIGLGDDLEYYVRLMCSVEHFGFIPEELFFVREHQSSRLSADTMNRKSLLSAIKTQKLVQACLGRAGYWSSEIRAMFWGAIRIRYANCLSYGTAEDVEEFEEWLRNLGRGDRTFRHFFVLIVLRRLFGAKAILFLHKGFVGLREQF
ncbi:MAG: glycosyltransferase family 2 protein [Desulfobulbaceae bacterium]